MKKLLLPIALLSWFVAVAQDTTYNVEWWSNLGAAVGGIFGTLAAGIAAFFAYRAYRTQREELRLQREEMALQRKEFQITRITNIIYKQIEVIEHALERLDLGENMIRIDGSITPDKRDISRKGLARMSSALVKLRTKKYANQDDMIDTEGTSLSRFNDSVTKLLEDTHTSCVIVYETIEDAKLTVKEQLALYTLFEFNMDVELKRFIEIAVEDDLSYYDRYYTKNFQRQFELLRGIYEMIKIDDRTYSSAPDHSFINTN